MTNLTRQDVDLVWDDACEGAFMTLKAALISAPVLAYPTREGHFTLSTDASDVGIGAVLEQDQEKGGQVVKRVIAYASKTPNDMQHCYCTTNKELFAVVMAIELFRYYLTGRHFTVVTENAKNADGLSRRTSRPCKRETCPECKPLRKEDSSKTEMARCYTHAFPYQRHFYGYVEMSEEDAALFWEIGNHPAPDPSNVESAITKKGRPYNGRGCS